VNVRFVRSWKPPSQGYGAPKPITISHAAAATKAWRSRAAATFPYVGICRTTSLLYVRRHTNLRSVDRRTIALLGYFKLFFELPISLIMGLVADIDQLASRIHIDVISLPIPRRCCHFIRSELLLLIAGNDGGSKARRRKQVLGLLRTGAAHS
jgi:hypothetical protein